jgi:2,5-diamino-6-(ribosylamino)-4(3H)-pyrimidinone 5'-phosphate reductase
MTSSVDGRIVVNGWPDMDESRREYERTAATFSADAWMCGRVTMEAFAGAVRDVGVVAREAETRQESVGVRSDFVAPNASPPYAVAIDPSGRLHWQTNDIDGDHVVAVLGSRVSDSYLADLRDRGVSYLFADTRPAEGAAGEEGREVDLAIALEKLAAAFKVRTLLLEGGGKINGAMLRDGLIDEISLLVAPVADGAVGAPSLFDVQAPMRSARRLALDSVEQRADDILWLRYRVE